MRIYISFSLSTVCCRLIIGLTDCCILMILEMSHVQGLVGKVLCSKHWTRDNRQAALPLRVLLTGLRRLHLRRGHAIAALLPCYVAVLRHVALSGRTGQGSTDCAPRSQFSFHSGALDSAQVLPAAHADLLTQWLIPLISGRSGPRHIAGSRLLLLHDKQHKCTLPSSRPQKSLSICKLLCG